MFSLTFCFVASRATIRSKIKAILCVYRYLEVLKEKTMNRKEYTDTELCGIAADLIEDLRECEDGTVTSTAELAGKHGYDDIDLFELHYALLDAAKANRITLDMSAHNGMSEGLPFNLPFTVRNRKAQIRCPYCGSTDTARYIYGYPLFTEEMQKKLEEKKWILGGCLINVAEVSGREISVMPERSCNSCGKDFGRPPVLIDRKKGTAEDCRDIVQSVRLSIGGFFTGHTEAAIRKNENGALVSTMKYPGDPELSKDVQITPETWKNIIDALYTKAHLHEWKKRYEDPSVPDGTQWELELRLTGNRVRRYYGSNAYPPYWPEVKKIFRQFVRF